MAALEPTPQKKNRNLLYIGIIAVAVLVVIVAVAGYLYLQDQDRQNSLREELKLTFGDQQNETDRCYALINGYPAAGNKNYVDDYQKWVDGYRLLADNYSLAVAKLAADGASYQAKLANDSSDYANVTEICREANVRAKSINSTAAGYEQDYQARLGLRTNASADFDLATGRSLALYNAAWSLMQQDANYTRFGGYHKFLIACDLNNSYYNSSISLAQSAAAKYQTYLTGNDYLAVNATISDLLANSARLGKRYTELQSKIPNVTVDYPEEPSLNYGQGQLYLSQRFRVVNNGWPMIIWNVVVHARLVDRATGIVRSTQDIGIDIAYPSTDYIYSTSLACDQNHNYDIKYTITFEY